MKQYINYENIVQESKQFIDQIQRCSIVLSTIEGNGAGQQTRLYEQDSYVILVPNGEEENALLYGNWNEALLASRRLLTNGSGSLDKIFIEEYTQ